MADAVISVVMERVADIIQDQIRYEVNLLRGVEKEVLDVSDKLGTIRDVLDDAEKRGAKEQSVKRWLKKLEDTAYEMEDILDEWNYTLLKYKMEDPAAADVAAAKQKVCCSFIPSSFLCFNKVSDRRTTAKKIQYVKATLDRILKEGDDFKFVVSQPTVDPLPKSWRVQSTSSIEFDKVYGRDEDRNTIVRKLIDNDDSQIMSIVGMGGIGKTTLAQLVYNDTQVKSCFEKEIWICVSDPFDVAGIARGIVESVTKESISPHITPLEFVLEKLRDCISGKKFLLVLDDVWTEDENKWKPLKINLQNGAQGSKILVTTRKDGVAKMMMRGNVDVEIYRPGKLSDKECWTLLRRISLSGRSEEECREFEDVGKKIAGKCEGLPLAAIVLGGLLESKKSLEEWENVLESEIWRLEEAEKDLFPHLLLSYNELSPALKRCFSYCAVYPKDYRINVEYLIEEWMALGYLGSVAGKGGVEVYRSLVWGKESPTTICDCVTSVRVLRFEGYWYSKYVLPQGMKKLIHLRWLDLGWLELNDKKLSKEDLSIICKLYFLQRLKIRFEDEYESLSPSSSSSSSLWMKVMEALEPNRNLKTLEIKGYKGLRLPDWMASPLNLIKEIVLYDLSELSSLLPMGKLPFLELLYIEKMMGLKLVGREFLGIECSSSSSLTSSNDVVAFPKLKKLEFHSCNNWEEWSDITAEEEESADVSIMPCLTKLRIVSCWRLKKLPQRLLRKTSSSLQILDIKDSSELVKSYQDKDGSPWRSISQYNPHLQLYLR